MIALIVAVVFVCSFNTVCSVHWTYSDVCPVKIVSQDHWSEHFPDCAGNAQSPINLIAGKTINGGSPIVIDGLHQKTGVTIVNNGHSIQANLKSGEKATFEIEGAKYKVLQFHFHWNEAGPGSEHHVNGNAYSMEMHIVAYNTKYSDGSTATPKSDGLAVLGFFFNVGDEDNKNLDTIVDAITKSTTSKKGTKRHVPLKDLIAPAVGGNYYRYRGSLTTPPCYESVTWTVFAEPLKLGKHQVNEFRTKTGIPFNNREIQDTNGREITLNIV